MSETERPLSFRFGFGISEPEEGTVRVGDPMPRLASVAHHDGMEVAVSWRSGLRAGKADVVDLAPAIMTYKVYRPLRDDPGLFKSVHLTADGTAIAWGADDTIDMAATTVELLAEETMTSSDFRAWLERHALTYEAAAAQLGISRRLVGYYAGKRSVPRYIALACRYLDSQHSAQMPSSADVAFIGQLMAGSPKPTDYESVRAIPEELAETGSITARFAGPVWIHPRPQLRTRR
jgi:hypothetical protein